MASSRARTRAAGLSAPFEPLERRTVLSAPTLTPLAPEATMSRVVFPVQFHSDSPIDLTSIGDGDIAVTGPNGFSQLAHLQTPPTVLSNGDVVARYVVRPTGGPWAQWEWPAANGTYNVGIVAGAVRNAAGESNAAGGAGSWWLWFNTPRITAGSQHVAYGAATYGPVVDSWEFDFTVAYPVPAYDTTALAVHVTGPGGFDQTVYAVGPYIGSHHGTYSTFSLTGLVTPPGGTWDFSDSGTYTVQVAVPEYVDSYRVQSGDVLSTQSYNLSLATPRADVVSTSFGMRDMTTTIRYTPAPGATINVASITNSDISLDGTLLGQLAAAPTTNADGTVTAIYRISSPRSGGWSYQDNGTHTIQTRTNQVTDSAGRAVGVGTIGQVALDMAQPSLIGLHTVAATSVQWDVEVSYRNVGGVIDTATLGSSGIGLALPGGITVPANVQFQSFSNSPDNILTARYRITPPAGGVLRDGTYAVFYGRVGVLRTSQQDDFNILPGTSTILDMHFAQAAVMGLRTISRTSTAWDIELDYSNPHSIIRTGSLGTQNLIVTAPAGRTVRLSMVSFATGTDQVLRVNYRILAATNGGTLARGLYSFALRSGSVFAGGVALPGQSITSVTI
jgi:hypothetical protein